jgi:hypothetical protein
MKAPLKGLGEVGYIPDQDAYELVPNAISELSNFRMLNGWAERIKGHRQVFDATAGIPYLVTPFATNTDKFIIHCTANQVYVDDHARTNITGALALSNLPGAKWTGGVLSGYLLLNNGHDAPFYWTGDTAVACAVLPDWDATFYARSLRTFKYHAVALNITKAGVACPHRVMWSAAAAPGAMPASWDIADRKLDSREVDVVGDGVLVDALPLGDMLILYKDHSMAAMTYVGGNRVFSIAPLPDPIGMLAPNCGCVVPGVGHVVLTQGDVVRHMGQGAVSILDTRAKKWLQDNIDPDYFANSFVIANLQKSEVWICFPERTYNVCTKALVWNWKSDTLSKRDLPNVTYGCCGSFNYAIERYDNDSVTFDSESVLTFNDSAEVFAGNEARVIVATTASKLFAMDSTDQADAVDFTGYIERTGLHFDAPDQRKLLKRMWLQIDAAAGAQISVYFGASNDPETAPTYQAPVTFTVGTSRYVTALAKGSHLAYKLSSTSWFRVRSAQLEIEPGGYH